MEPFHNEPSSQLLSYFQATVSGAREGCGFVSTRCRSRHACRAAKFSENLGVSSDGAKQGFTAMLPSHLVFRGGGRSKQMANKGFSPGKAETKNRQKQRTKKKHLDSQTSVICCCYFVYHFRPMTAKKGFPTIVTLSPPTWRFKVQVGGHAELSTDTRWMSTCKCLLTLDFKM